MGYGNGGPAFDKHLAMQNQANQGTANIAPRPLEIPSRFDDLTKRTEVLHSFISDLEQRLAPVLAAEPPTPTEGASAMPIMTPLANGIAEQAGRVELACDRLRRILGRLEL